MRALMIPRFGGPEVLEIQDVAAPQPTADQLLINVEAGGLNFADLMTAQGGYASTPKPPLIAGREFAGLDGSGRRVMGYTQYAAFAEQTAAPRSLLWPAPVNWSAEQAAAFPVNFFTAYFAYWKAGLIDGTGHGAVGNGPTGNGAAANKSAASGGTNAPARVLIHAVAGGVGTAAVQIGKILGIEMYGTSSSEEKLEKARALGLQHGINYKQKDYVDAIKEMTDGRGVDAVFEMLGGDNVAKSVRCVGNFGRVIVYGSATGQTPTLDTRLLYAKGASVHGLWLTYLCQNRELMSAAWRKLEAWLNEGKLNPVIGHVFPLAEARDAYTLLQQGKNYGKIVLRVK